MQIDLFTFVAQVVNFLVLLFLLQRFLYRPILRAMNQREERIRAELEEAEEKKEEADREGEEYRRRQRELEQRRERMLAGAAEEAERRREELLERARGEVEESRSRWRRSLQEEKEDFLRELRRRAGEGLVEAMRRALGELADAELERQVVRSFLNRLAHPDEEERRVLQELLPDAQRVRIDSAFEIGEPERRAIREALPGELPGERLEFGVSPRLVCGLELSVDNRKIRWDLGSYLGGLEEELASRIEAQAGQPRTEAADAR